MSRFFVAGFLALALVGCCCSSRLVKVSGVKEKVEGETLSAKLEKVTAWCDHMPVIEPGERRQYLALGLVLENKTDDLVSFKIERIHASLDVDKLGLSAATFKKEIIFADDNDRLKDQSGNFTLGPRQKMMVVLQCKELFAEDNHGKRLYAAVTIIAASGEKIMVRGMGEIGETS